MKYKTKKGCRASLNHIIAYILNSGDTSNQTIVIRKDLINAFIEGQKKPRTTQNKALRIGFVLLPLNNPNSQTTTANIDGDNH